MGRSKSGKLLSDNQRSSLQGTPLADGVPHRTRARRPDARQSAKQLRRGSPAAVGRCDLLVCGCSDSRCGADAKCHSSDTFNLNFGMSVESGGEADGNLAGLRFRDDGRLHAEHSALGLPLAPWTSAEKNVNGLFGSKDQKRDPAKRRDPAEYQDECDQLRPRGRFAPDFHQRFLPHIELKRARLI